MLLFSISPAIVIGQGKLEGKVIDAENGNAIPFVPISPLDHEEEGVQTDIDGRFSLRMPKGCERLLVSSMGYHEDTVRVPESGDALRIELHPKPVQKRAVEVRPGKDPAIPIIRKAIARRKIHDPLQQKAFRYRSYSKIVYSERSLDLDSSWAAERKDTLTPSSLDRDSSAPAFPDSVHALLMETVSERNYQKGRLDKKKVLGARVSGFQDPPFTAVASELQEISFYRNYIELFGQEYRSPISQGGWRKYDYRLRKTLIEGKDSLYFIRFQPKPAQEEQALRGLLVIGSDGYALRSIRVGPVKQGPNPVRIEQRYLQKGKASFPKEMNFEVRIPSIGMVYNGKSRLQGIRIGEGVVDTVDRKDLSIQKMKGYGERDAAFWKENRSFPLTGKDSSTYEFIDSLGREQDLDRWIEVMEKAVKGRFPLKGFDLRLYELYRYNAYEKHRPGIGMETNEKLSPYVRAGAYWGYGIADERMKYGVDLEFRPTGTREWRLGAYYRKELTEPGRYTSPRQERFFGRADLLGESSQRELYKRRVLAIEEKGVRFRTSRPRYVTFALWGKKSKERPLYKAPFPEGAKSPQELTLLETGLRGRFAFKEGTIRSFGRKWAIESPYPVLQAKLVKGWRGKGLGGERSYWRFLARLEHEFQLRGLGAGSFALDIGGVAGNIPFSRLYYAPGTFSRELPFSIPRSFNTADRYSYLHSHFLHFFYEQGLFRFTLWKDRSRPFFELRHHMGWGERRAVPRVKGEQVGTMSKGYYESGLSIEDLLIAEVQELYTYGVGISADLRYGPYHTPGFWRNIAYGIEFSLEF